MVKALNFHFFFQFSYFSKGPNLKTLENKFENQLIASTSLPSPIKSILKNVDFGQNYEKGKGYP